MCKIICLIYYFVFPAIGNAVSVLTDPEKRKQYDLYGEEPGKYNAANRNGEQHYHAYTRGFEGLKNLHIAILLKIFN